MKSKLSLIIMIAFVIGAMFANTAYAGDEAKKLEKAAVKQLTGKGVSEDTAAALTEILCTRLMSHKKYQVLCSSDMTAILVATQQTALLGNCDDQQCYDALGKALDAKYIIVGTIGKIGKIQTINLSLISASEKIAKKRVTHEVSGDESKLIQGVKEAADKLMK